MERSHVSIKALELGDWLEVTCDFDRRQARPLGVFRAPRVPYSCRSPSVSGPGTVAMHRLPRRPSRTYLLCSPCEIMSGIQFNLEYEMMPVIQVDFSGGAERHPSCTRACSKHCKARQEEWHGTPDRGTQMLGLLGGCIGQVSREISYVQRGPEACSKVSALECQDPSVCERILGSGHEAPGTQCFF